MTFATDVSPACVDIETGPDECAREHIPAPDLSTITAPSNYVKQEAIDGYIEREKAKRLADFEQAVTSGAALDRNVGRVVALGWWTAESGYQTLPCPDVRAEADAIERWWQAAAHRNIIGFCCKGFDLPFLIQRSRYLGIKHPRLELGKYSDRGVIDLYMMLTFNEGKYDQGLMPHTLKAFGRRFGLPVEDETHSGADVPALVRAGDWDAVLAHLLADLRLTVGLAKRLGVLWHEEVQG